MQEIYIGVKCLNAHDHLLHGSNICVPIYSQNDMAFRTHINSPQWTWLDGRNISDGERERELWRGGSLTCNLRRSKWRRKRWRRRRTTSAGLGPASVRTRDQIKMWHHSILVPHILVIFQPAHLHTVSSFITTNIIRTQVREWTYLNSIGQVICGHGFRDVTRCSSWCAGLF